MLKSNLIDKKSQPEIGSNLKQRTKYLIIDHLLTFKEILLEGFSININRRFSNKMKKNEQK